MTMLLQPANMAGELYVRALALAYQRGYRIYDPDYAHIQDPTAFEKLRRDPEIAHAMIYRKHLIAGRDWFLQPRSDAVEDSRAAKMVNCAFEELAKFTNARFHLADAVFRGSSIMKIVGKRAVRKWVDGKPREWWFPTRLVHVDRWRFRQVPVYNDIGTPVTTRWEYFAITQGAGEWVPLTRKQRQFLVVHKYQDTEDTLGYGRGLLEALYHFYYAKTVVLTEGLQGIERWAQGWVTAEINDLRIGSTDRDNDAQVEKWLQLLEKFRARHVAVHGRDEKITIHESSGTGHEMVMSMLGYLDTAMSRLVLAGVLPTGGGHTEFGSLARAKEEAASTESLIQFDRESLSEDLTTDLVALFWRLNRANIASCGLCDAGMPRYIVQHNRKTDPIRGVEVVMNALTLGIPLRRDEVYEAIGFSPPNPEDVTIDGIKQGEGDESGLQLRNPTTGKFMAKAGAKTGAETGSGQPAQQGTPPSK